RSVGGAGDCRWRRQPGVRRGRPAVAGRTRAGLASAAAHRRRRPAGERGDSDPAAARRPAAGRHCPESPRELAAGTGSVDRTGIRGQRRLRARAPDPGLARAAWLAAAGGRGRFGIPRRLGARSTGRLLQRHQPRAADRWRRALVQRAVGGELSDIDHRAGGVPARATRDRWLRDRAGKRRRAGCAPAGGRPAAGGPGVNPSPTTLLRPDLRGFAGYRSARSSMAGGDTWLNANESAWPNPADDDARVRRYPDPQPSALRALMATRYGCRPEQVLVGRGSDEGIDLLVRAFCRPGGDAVVVTPPTFGMYEVCARLHGARVVAVPLVDGERGFACDFDEVGNAALAAGARLVFLCSPGNPVGSRLSLAAIESLALRLRGRALVVVDEAYIEY